MTSAAPTRKGGAARRTPGEPLVADAWAMKRLAARLHGRLLERSLASLGAMATLRNVAISLLRLAGVENIAAATRYLGRQAERPLRFLGL